MDKDEFAQHSSSKLVKVGELLSLMNIYALGTAMQNSMITMLEDRARGGELGDAEIEAQTAKMRGAIDPEEINSISTQIASAMYEELFDESELDELIATFRDREIFKRLAAAAATLNSAVATAVLSYIVDRARDVQE